MAQFARPDADITRTSWSGSPMWSRLDETVASDADLISSVFATGNRAEVSLSSITDPNQSGSHRIRFRGRITGTEPGDLTVAIYESGVLRASHDFGSLSGSFATYSYTLSASEADSIGDYSNLSMRFSGVAPGLGADMECEISWAEFEVPDPIIPVSSSSTSVYESLKFVSQNL